MPRRHRPSGTAPRRWPRRSAADRRGRPRSRSISTPLGVNCSENVRPPSRDTSSAPIGASMAYIRSCLRTILCRSLLPRRDSTRQLRPPSSETMRPRSSGSAPASVGMPGADEPARAVRRELDPCADGPRSADRSGRWRAPASRAPTRARSGRSRVRREHEVLRLGIDLERVDERRRLRRIDEAARRRSAGAPTRRPRRSRRSPGRRGRRPRARGAGAWGGWSRGQA